MEDTIVSFEVAKLLKDREFNENCSYYYIHELGNSGYFKKLHGSLSMFKVQDDSGDTIGYSKRKNSPGQPHIIIAPTLSLAQKWLREVHNIHIQIIFLHSNNRYVFEIYKYGEGDIESVLEYTTYELALEEGIKQALNLIK